MRNGIKLAIEFRPRPELSDTLFVDLLLKHYQAYYLEINTQNISSIVMGKTWLIDKYLHSKTEISLSDTTRYYFAYNADVKSFHNRFMLVYNNEEEVTASENSSSANHVTGISIFPNPVTKHIFNLQLNNLEAGRYEALVYDSKGRLMLERVLEHTGKNEAYKIMLPLTIANGVYKLVVRNNTTIINSSISLVVAE